jgi:hypothetical protein
MNISEHTWVLENIASYSAGGLEVAERERLEEHISACAACAQALEEARAVDRSMEALFADVRLEPAVEDRVIRALRAARPRSRQWYWVSLSAAAVLLLGFVGAGMSHLIEAQQLPFPGLAVALRDSQVAQGSQGLLHGVLHGLTSGISPDTRGQASGGMAEVTDGTHNTIVVLDDTKSMKDSETLAEETRKSAVELLDSFGYHPPARALVSQSERQSGGKLHLDGSPVSRDDRGMPNGSTGVDAWDANTGRPAASSPMADSRSGKNMLGRSSDAGVGGMTGMDQKGAEKPTSAAALGDQSKKAGMTIYNGEVANFYTYRNAQPAPAAGPVGAGGTGVGGGGQFAAFGMGVAPPAEPSVQQLSEAKSLEEAKERYQSLAKLRYQVRGATSEEDVRAAKLTYERFLREQGRTPEASVSVPETPARVGTVAVVGNTITKNKGEGKARSAEPEGEPGQPKAAATAGPRKIVIRSGDIEYEIESFDSAVATVTKLVTAIKGGFVATVNSEKLPNGKVRGSVVVRVPPESLDTFVLDLRKELGKGGELKTLRIGSQDITKQYTDLESRLKAARTMEERLLQIIKSGKGEIKDLLQAEKELGVWRTKIEEIEGELRYYGNLVALSTLTITLYERELRAPYGVIEIERVQMGVEVEDVDKSLQQALAAVAEAKGRVTKSELKQLAAGQFTATLNFEVAPLAAGPLRDRLKQLGVVARLEIDRLQQTEGGTGRPYDGRSKRNDTQFFVSLYNLANVAPRDVVQLNLACLDVEAVYRTILARVQKATGRVVTSNLNRQRGEQTTGTIQFEVKSADADAVLGDLKAAGEVLHLQFTENPDAPNLTRSKRGFNVQLWAMGLVAPRETAVLQVATRDVPKGYRELQEAVAKAKGRMLNAQLNEQDKQNITAQLDFDVRRTDEATIDAVLAKIGDITSRNVTRAQDSENMLDSKVRLQVALINVSKIPPRETYVLGLEVANVDQTAATFSAMVNESQGRTVESHVARERSGRVTAKLVFDVPLASAAGLVEKFKGAGIVRVQQSTRNPQVAEGPTAIARLDVTVSNTELIVPSDDGLWPQIRRGLSNSLLAIFWSLSWVIFGVLFLLPWALVFYGIYRIVSRIWRRTATAQTPASSV